MAASVTLKQAMETLTTMFPHIDRDVMIAVLQEQNGYLERSIEILLDMNAQIPDTAESASTHATHAPGGPLDDLPADFLSLQEVVSMLYSFSIFVHPSTG